MSDSALTTTVDTALVEKVVIGGDLSRLDAGQRMDYYSAVCTSLGLNPLTRPFDYLDLHGKLVLYAKRDAADQLRKIHGISIDKPEVKIEDDLVIVTVTGRDQTGRTDSELGVVYLGRKTGDDKANVILKAITKAKRRLTLSIVGLGWLDETEVETIQDAQQVYPEEQRASIDAAAELAEAKREAESVEPPTAARMWPDATIKAVMDAEYARPARHAVKMLNLSRVLVTTDEPELVLTWCKFYREQRDGGQAPEGAAKFADAQMPQLSVG